MYDLSQDLGETQDVADQRPDVVSMAETFALEARSPNPNWEVPAP